MPSDDDADPPWGSDAAAVPAWGTPESAGEVLAAQLEDRRLRRTGRFTVGYDADEVDHFLGRVLEALRGVEPEASGLHWREVADRTFFPTRWRSGYHPDDVDAVLELAARELRRRHGD